MLKRLKRKDNKDLLSQVEALKGKINTLKEGMAPYKVKTISLKQELEAQKAQTYKWGYQTLQERLSYVLSYFQDYDQNIVNAEKAIADIESGMRKKSYDEETLESIEDMVEDFDIYIAELEEIDEELKDIELDMRVKTEKKPNSTILEFKEFGDRVSDFVKRSFNKDDSTNPKSKTSKLLKILPFLEHEEKQEMVSMILSDNEYFKDIKLAVIMPFLDKEDCDKIFRHAIKKEYKSLASLVPFVSEGLLSEVVEDYIQGKISIDMNILYPFLTVEDIKKIFFYELKQKEQ